MNTDSLSTLARIVQPLEPTKAAIVRESFERMFVKIEGWQLEANDLFVVSEDDTRKMKAARLLRLEIKEARVGLEKKRKDMKAGILLEGKAIDGAFAIFESMAAPLEKHLLEQETFAERLKTSREEEIRKLRTETLFALGMRAETLPAALGTMLEEVWQDVLRDAKAAKDYRDKCAQRAEAAHVEAKRILAEQEEARRVSAKQAAEQQAAEEAKAREEDRVTISSLREKNEQAEREVAAAAFVRSRAERLAQEEQTARLKAEGEARALEQREQERIKREAETKKPTKAKYNTMIAALREIANLDEDLESNKAGTIARQALASIGEPIEGNESC